MEEILVSINFQTLINNLKTGVFKNHQDIFDIIFDDFIILCENNFTCYKANMSVIKCRKSSDVDHKQISYFEGLARTVGESRVNCKAKINRKIHNMFNNPETPPENWMSDDIVYSVGEMLDRISIEFIKQNHFSMNQDDKPKIEISYMWENRVEKYLEQKLNEIKRKQFYSVVDETRTYKI